MLCHILLVFAGVSTDFVRRDEAVRDKLHRVNPFSYVSRLVGLASVGLANGTSANQVVTFNSHYIYM